MTDSTEKVTYEARCHCGAVTYKVKIPQLEPPTSSPVVHCNCSICHRNGYLLVYPLKEDVEILTGQDQLKEYWCIGRKAPHMFCPTCASSLWINPPKTHPLGDVYCMNIRMFRGIELDKLTFQEEDGKSENRPEYNEQYW